MQEEKTIVKKRDTNTPFLQQTIIFINIYSLFKSSINLPTHPLPSPMIYGLEEIPRLLGLNCLYEQQKISLAQFISLHYAFLSICLLYLLYVNKVRLDLI